MTARPRLRAGVRLQHDRHAGQWLLLGPERALALGETAHAIVELLDGTRCEPDIAELLAARYAAPAGRIADDVARLLAELRARCLIEDV